MALGDGTEEDDPDPPVEPPESPELPKGPENSKNPVDPEVLEPPLVEVSGVQYESGRGHSGLLRRRRIPPIRIVDGVSFTIVAGEAVGLVGVPGAGKSALMKLLTGQRVPTGGTVRIGGRPPVSAAGPGGRIGVVSAHQSQLWPDQQLSQALRTIASMHHLPEPRWIARRTELVQRLGLAACIDLPVHRLSPGQRILGETAAALLSGPDLVVLDQPTLGIDAASKERLRSFLRQERRVHGRTILITSGEISDVECCCDRILVLDQGRLAYDGDLAALIEQADAQRVLVVDLVRPDRLLDDVPGTRLFSVEAGGLRQRLNLPRGSISTARVLADIAARAPIRNLAVEAVSMADVVRRLAPPHRPGRSPGSPR